MTTQSSTSPRSNPKMSTVMEGSGPARPRRAQPVGATTSPATTPRRCSELAAVPLKRAAWKLVEVAQGGSRAVITVSVRGTGIEQLRTHLDRSGSRDRPFRSSQRCSTRLASSEYPCNEPATSCNRKWSLLRCPPRRRPFVVLRTPLHACSRQSCPSSPSLEPTREIHATVGSESGRMEMSEPEDDHTCQRT
jgi:hypothetical protein